MYRDHLEAYRARLEAARQDVEAAWAAVRGQLELLEVLRGQLVERGLGVPEVPRVDPPELRPEPGPEVEAAELARLAGEAEGEARRLRERGAALGRLAELLNRRARGEAVTLPLGPPPRPVPALYGLAELATLWVLVAMTIGVGLAWSAEASSGLDGLVPLLLPGVALLLGAVPALLRIRFLSRCAAAPATQVVESGGDGSSMTNWPLRRSKGWDVTVEGYTGSGVRDVVEFVTEDGRAGRLVVKGTGYEDGVVLYDPATLRARDVKQVPCCPRPDGEGRWAPRLDPRGWLRVVLLVLLAGAWAASVVKTFLG